MHPISFNEIEGIRVGHARNLEGPTGATVVMAKKGAPTGVDARGGAPGTRETDLLHPVNLVQEVHAIMLAGGSTFGLDAAGGITAYLEERGIGFDVAVTRVPIVCGAVLFDLALGNHSIRPDRDMGYQACVNAESDNPSQGNVGAGTGAMVGKILGKDRAMKGGLGSFAFEAKDLKVGALVAVNCLGDVVAPDTEKRLAGVLNEDMRTIGDTEAIMIEKIGDDISPFSGNTTIGVVATNARLNKTEMTKVAAMAHNGYARAIRPCHTLFDGDTLFAMSTGNVKADLSTVGVLAARAVARAVNSAIINARGLWGLLCHGDLFP